MPTQITILPSFVNRLVILDKVFVNLSINSRGSQNRGSVNRG